MSVILESQPGDELVCIEAFSGPSDGMPSSSSTNRRFRIGERVRYASFRQDQNLKDNPAGWLLIFEAKDGNRYAATETYFVTDECWRGLKQFFAKRVVREPRRRKLARK